MLAVVLGLVAVLTVVAVVVSSNRQPTEFDPASPEGTVQTYLRAVFDGRSEEAAALLAADSPCGAVDLDRTYVPDPMRVVLLGTTTETDRAWVHVRIMPPDAEPLAPQESGEEQTFRLVRSGDGWALAGVPWPMFDCAGGSS